MGRIVRLLCKEFGSYCNRVSQAWNEFWFTPRDPYAICVIRCLVGWMAFYTTLVWGLELEAFFHPQSFISDAIIQDHFANYEGSYALSFWSWVPVEWMHEVHYLCLAITFCFMIGLFTRVTSVLSLVILISYAYRARFASYGLDQINVILTLYLCIGNSGAYLSVDRLIKRFRTVKQKIRLGNGLWKLPQKIRATVATNIATRLIQFHYCVIYMASGMGKLYGETWWNGTAMWRGLANAEYQTMDLTWLAFYPGVTEFLTHLTIAWEISFCFLVWRPLARPWVLLIGAGMHLGIGMFLGMWTFGTCMIFGYLAYLGPGQLRELARHLRNLLFNSEPKVLEVNSSLPHSVVSASWKKTFDIADRLVLVVDGSRPEDQAKQEDRQGAAFRVNRVIMLDLEGELYQKFSFPMIQAGLQFNYVGTSGELQEAIEQFPESAVLVNLDGFSDLEVRNYLEATLAVSFKFYPCVTLIRNQQAHWLEDILLEDYQRILIQPCDAKDVLTELQRAFHFYDELFPGIPRQISDISGAGKQPSQFSDVQEPVNNVVDQFS